MVAIGGAIILFLIAINLFSSDTEEVKREYDLQVLPNADGVRKELAHTTPVILQIDIDGLIGTDKLNQQTIRQQLLESREGDLANDRVKALLIRINSMGGTVVDSDGIYHAIREYKEQYDVPVYAYIDGFCASGGYYIACATDKIFSSGVSLVGSVGIRLAFPFFNLTNVLEKFEIPVKTFAKGKDKDALNPFRKWKPNEGEGFEEIMTYYYDDFVNIVLKNRTAMNREKLIDVYGAEVFPAAQAKEFGFIDETGISWRETVKQLLNDLGLEEDSYQVLAMKKEPWIQQLFNASEAVHNGAIRHTFSLHGDPASELHSPLAYLYTPHG